MEQITKTETPQEVEIRIIRKENEFLKRQLEIAQTFQAKMGLTLNKIKISDLFEKKLLQCKAQELSRVTMYNYRTARDYFSKWANSRGFICADEIEPDHTDEFWVWFKNEPGVKNNEPLTENTRIHVWQEIKATFQYAYERNSILKNPFRNRVFPYAPIRDWWDDKYFYDLQEAIETYSRPGVVNRNLITTRGIYTTGIRIVKFMAVKNKDVIHTNDDNLILITRRKIRKSSRFQEFPIEILNKKLKDDYFNFYEPSKPDKFVLADSKTILHVYNAYRRSLKGEPKQNRIGFCEKAGIPYKNPHKAKHGFITKMLNKGFSASQICKMVGNSDPGLIERTYNHIQFTDFKDRVKKNIENL